jgi:hypothetical protein
MNTFVRWFVLPALVCRATFSQNVIQDRATGPTAPVVQFSEAQALFCIDHSERRGSAQRHAESERIGRKLDRHVNEFLAGAPWRPFHHTLGISGYEVAFHHPDEMFYALSLALPFLPTNTAVRTRSFLARQLLEIPPYAREGFDARVGRPREPYDVPRDLRVAGRGKAGSAFGVYAFWSYMEAARDHAAGTNHWPAIKQRIQPLLETDYQFDITKRNYRRDEAEALNGNLAALIATVRLARTNVDASTAQKALARVRQLLELRVNLERANPQILENTESSTKHLHSSKLARFCSLTPEVSTAVRTLTDGCGPAHLKNFREARPAWHLAFGDRMIGGENYTNPTHFSRALFAGAALVEQLPPEQLASLVDVPWCRGDFFFIEKCALTLAR